jgi:DNA mismatch repair protein MutL
MSVINILPDELASQIAAGEVVERPSSVVKELLENSIDSGADNIEIRIQAGGKRKIRIMDNGVGMSAEDLAMCIRRHATSKIRSISDLYSVKTLGFRGEALASIASVARVRIISRLHDALAGNLLICEGGSEPELREIGCPPGTCVEVNDLFFNVPVRKKFLKSDRTEAAHVLDQIERTALPHRSIRVFVENDGRDALLLPACEDPIPRIAAIVGKDAAERMEQREAAAGPSRIKAYLAPGEMALQRSDGIYTYLNGRYIRDKTITRAVMEGYSKRILKGQYPRCILFIEMPPENFDVNVHPTKQEVRFREPQAVFSFIAGAVARGVEKRSFPSAMPEGWVNRKLEIPQSLVVSEAKAEYLPGSAPIQRPAETHRPSSFRLIGQLGLTYILCENKDGLVMVDQHAAHERILYEKLKRQISERRIMRQSLLFPMQIELSHRDTAAAMKNLGNLDSLGFELDHFGANSFLLKSAPDVLSPAAAVKAVQELLQHLGEGVFSSERVLDGVLCVMACHGAIRANSEMHKEEMERLLIQLEEAGLPTNCPHGRPIFYALTYRDLERLFKRAV